MCRRSNSSAAIVAFLRNLLSQVPGKLLPIWDGAPIHHYRPARDFLDAGADARIHLEQSSAYAPELNPGRKSGIS